MEIPTPDEIIIYAIEVENVMEFNEQPTPAVADAIPRAVKLVMQEIENNR